VSPPVVGPNPWPAPRRLSAFRLENQSIKLIISVLIISSDSERPALTDAPDLERSLGFLLHDVSHLLRRNFNRRVQHLGLTQTQWRAIAHLSRDEGMNQAALAETLEVQPITLARLIDRMAAAGWVERRPDPRDRRAVRLYLTEQVQPILAEMWAIAAQAREDALAGLPEERREMLIEVLRHMKATLLEADQKIERGDSAPSRQGQG